MLRISLVDFLNARPLTWGLLHEPPPGVSVSRDVPSACAAKLAAGEADVGLIPSIEYARIPGLKVVPGLGIAASSEVRSVLLVSDVSRERIRSVELDPASRTSAALTRILLKRVYGLSPEYRERGGEADARLIIGDPALKTRLNGHVVLDLAAEWRAFSGHPFVFAFWAVRSEKATPAPPILRSRVPGVRFPRPRRVGVIGPLTGRGRGLPPPRLAFRARRRRPRWPGGVLPAGRGRRTHLRGPAARVSRAIKWA
jgi:predicted solute-binding protein